MSPYDKTDLNDITQEPVTAVRLYREWSEEIKRGRPSGWCRSLSLPSTAERKKSDWRRRGSWSKYKWSSTRQQSSFVCVFEDQQGESDRLHINKFHMETKASDLTFDRVHVPIETIRRNNSGPHRVESFRYHLLEVTSNKMGPCINVSKDLSHSNASK